MELHVQRIGRGVKLIGTERVIRGCARWEGWNRIGEQEKPRCGDAHAAEPKRLRLSTNSQTKIKITLRKGELEN